MNWLIELGKIQPVAYAVLVLSIVAIIGLAIGSVKVRGASIGVAGVLFAGIFMGHFGFHINPSIIDFVRDFGLILFVYTIGLQVGPSFVSSLKKEGLRLNLMAIGVVLCGALITIFLAYLFKIDIAAAVGIFSGATTNTPSLGAAQEALKTLPSVSAERLVLPSLGYAVAYPFGVLGIIISMLLVKGLLKIDLTQEAESFKKGLEFDVKKLERVNFEILNKNLDGITIEDLPGRRELGVVISRIKKANGQVEPALRDMVLNVGDIILAVGTKKSLEQFELIIGKRSNIDLLKIPSDVVSRRIVATHKEVLGKSLRELGLHEIYGVNVTRVTRSDIELTAVADLKLQFGDMLQVVGEPEDIDKVAKFLGNSLQELNHTNLVPVFIGIALGIILGTYPLSIGNIPAPVRLGLAGGPLIVAIILSRIGKIGPLVWYMPVNANIAMRELGIVLFLGCVGLKAGDQFIPTLVNGDGLLWMGCGAVITFIPMLLLGFLGRLVFNMNFMNICGVMAGSMTDPPALAFANSVTKSDAPAIAYAAVYPLTMILRILVAQFIVLFLIS
ncbi:MAG TPA: putative transporter [Verrucomicrobiota bacterium]|nr:putative transporter [Verrucomicrobiota bacterium]